MSTYGTGPRGVSYVVMVSARSYEPGTLCQPQEDMVPSSVPGPVPVRSSTG
jgi:hypothetical protein